MNGDTKSISFYFPSHTIANAPLAGGVCVY